jgi:5-methyltetrahydropteroyltriglutamate--homocysteine methyltransferase
MTARRKPPFRADQVGSLIRPDSLVNAWQAEERKEISEAERKHVQRDAIRDVVRLQEDLGLKAVTDGEYNREGWQRDFLLKIANVKLVPSKVPTRFHSAQGVRDHKPPTLAVEGKLSRPAPIFVDDFVYLKSIARSEPKLTIPSPTILHFRGGRETIDEKAYPHMDQFYADLAGVYREEIADLGSAGLRYLQVDDTNFAYLCDPELRAHARSIGEDPDVLPHTYARLINEAISGRPSDMTVCMHVCRGNYGGAWVASGGYEPVADVIFNEIAVDGYFLEYDSDRAGGFEPLRFVPKGKTVVLGLVTSKSPQLESKDALKRRIEEATKYVALDQLCLSPQCGFASGIAGAAMDFEQQVAKLRLVVETAREVWGSD